MSKLVIDDTRKFAFQYQGTLNIVTPPGLFESDEGDRYLVSHASNGNLAIVLRHRVLRSFTVLRLGPDDLATGNGLGDGEIEFLHEAQEDDFGLGTILHEYGGWLEMRCRFEGTELVWASVAGTDEQLAQGAFDGWRLTKWGQTFFELAPPRASIKQPYPFQLLGPSA